MKSDLKLLDEKALNYFDSINDLFQYRLKNYWKYTTSTNILAIFFLFAFLNFVPIIPGFSDDDFYSWILNIANDKLLITLKVNFWTKWLIGIIISGVPFVIFYLIQRYWSHKIDKKAISFSAINFCYLFMARKELRNYLINERDEHIQKTNKYINKVLNSIDRVTIDDKEFLKISELINKIKKSKSWFSLDEKTKSYIEALESIENKIFERLKQKVLIDELLETIDWLTLYEYSKLKPNELIDGEKRVGDNTYNYFDKFISSIINLSAIDLPINETLKSQKGIRTLLSYFKGLLSNDNIIQMFFSWLILLSILFFVVSIIVIQSLNIKIDSTFIIGMLSAPFIGAITFSATIYSKKEK